MFGSEFIIPRPDLWIVISKNEYSGTYKCNENLHYTFEGDQKWSTLWHLPNDLTVNGNLDLSNSFIKNLPDNLTVHGDLKLPCAIKMVPTKHHIYGKIMFSI